MFYDVLSNGAWEPKARETLRAAGRPLGLWIGEEASARRINIGVILANGVQ